MRENVDKALSVEDIAKICGMSSSNLKKIFAKSLAFFVYQISIVLSLHEMEQMSLRESFAKCHPYSPTSQLALLLPAGKGMTTPRPARLNKNH